MFTLFFNGLLAGIWLLGVLTPALLLFIVGVTIYRLTREKPLDAFTLMEDFPPDLPTPEEESETAKPHRFIASTIVRPPEISERKDDDTEDES